MLLRLKPWRWHMEGVDLLPLLPHPLQRGSKRRAAECRVVLIPGVARKPCISHITVNVGARSAPKIVPHQLHHETEGWWAYLGCSCQLTYMAVPLSSLSGM